mgnify:CR=1 FL=1
MARRVVKGKGRKKSLRSAAIAFAGLESNGPKEVGAIAAFLEACKELGVRA